MSTSTTNQINFSQISGNTARGLAEEPQFCNQILEEFPFTDSSSALFSLYLSHAEKHDRDQFETWKAGADGILVFTGLFATALATFVIDSYKSLLPDSAGNTVILLAQISQQLDGLANRTTASKGSSSSLLQSNWKPPSSAVWVNVLWFLSLVISLFCALLATLQQRWARRYLQLTQPQLAIHKRARIRSFFAEGVTKFHLDVAVEAIPALLHVSVFLFLAGLVISLFNIHHTVAYVVLASSVACVVVYAAITVMPAIYHDCPYTSPFSALAWYISRKTVLAMLKAEDFVKKHTSLGEKRTTPPLSGGNAIPANPSPFRVRLSRNMTRAAYYVALGSDNGMISRALGWTLDKMDEEGELVQFAAGIPGFSHSTEVKDALSILEEAQKRSTLHPSLYRHITNILVRSARPGLLPDSKLLPESVRQERIKICLEALYFLPHAIEKLLARAADQLYNKKVVLALSPLLQSVESWLVAERLSKPGHRIHQDVTIAAQCVAAVLATQMPDEQTEPIVMLQLDINHSTLRRYVTNGHSLLLKNLTNFLKNTALKYIDMDTKKFHIVLSAVVLAQKDLEKGEAQQELRDEYEELLTKIESHKTASSLGNTSTNATELFSALTESSPGEEPPAQNAQAGASAPWSEDDAASTAQAAAMTTRVYRPTGRRSSPPPPLQPVLRYPGDAIIPIAYPPSPQERVALVSIQSRV